MEKKTVLITGASSGIGEGCARKFAMNGYRLILNGRNVEKLTAVKRELETEYRADVCLLPFDVRDRGAAKAALDSLPEEWKAIDILINNAGLVIGVDKEHEGNPDEWDIVLDTNIKALLAMTHSSGLPSCSLSTPITSKGVVRRLAHRPCGYSRTGDQHQARFGGDEFLRSAFPWRQGGCR